MPPSHAPQSSTGSQVPKLHTPREDPTLSFRPLRPPSCPHLSAQVGITGPPAQARPPPPAIIPHSQDLESGPDNLCSQGPVLRSPQDFPRSSSPPRVLIRKASQRSPCTDSPAHATERQVRPTDGAGAERKPGCSLPTCWRGPQVWQGCHQSSSPCSPAALTASSLPLIHPDGSSLNTSSTPRRTSPTSQSRSTRSTRPSITCAPP